MFTKKQTALGQGLDHIRCIQLLQTSKDFQELLTPADKILLQTSANMLAKLEQNLRKAHCKGAAK